MARPLRIQYPGAWYHVMNRGAGHRKIFPDDHLRLCFLDLLESLHDMYSVCCHAYCLMSNHYHLLVQTRQANLARAMQYIDGVYAQRHNRHLQTDGPLFRGRYRAQLIEHERYLWCVSRYVHRNPLVAGLCPRAVDYPWSSCRYLAGERPAPDWLHMRQTLLQFGSARQYCAFVENDAGDDDEALLLGHGAEKYAPILGSEEFIAAAMRHTAPDFEIPHSKSAPTAISLDCAVDLVCERSGLSPDELVAASDQHARLQRAMVMMLARRYGGYSLRELAGAFGIASYTTVASAISRCRDRAARDPALARELQWLRARIAKMRNA